MTKIKASVRGSEPVQGGRRLFLVVDVCTDRDDGLSDAALGSRFAQEVTSALLTALREVVRG